MRQKQEQETKKLEQIFSTAETMGSEAIQTAFDQAVRPESGSGTDPAILEQVLSRRAQTWYTIFSATGRWECYELSRLFFSLWEKTEAHLKADVNAAAYGASSLLCQTA